MEIRISILIAIILVLILGFSASGSNQRITFLDRTVFENPKEPTSVFGHDSHYLDQGIECNECHHVYENGVLVKGKSSENKRCSECHPLKPTKDEKLTLMKAFHMSCQGCHEKKKEGPVMCGNCHKRYNRF